MGGGQSSTFATQQSLLEEEEGAKQRRVEWICDLFPIESREGDTAPSSASFQRYVKNGVPPYLSLLPPEIIENIVNRLDNRATKNLRLTCQRFAAIVPLRINRVFLSANPLNIQVFRAIADHDVLRHKIVEIIYDDARLWRSAIDASDWLKPGKPPSDIEWFKNERDTNIKDLRLRRRLDDERRPEHVAMARRVRAELPLAESWAHYQDLLRQQEEIVASDADADALRYGLQRFPSLRKVTVTPAAHGWLFTPLYETPMIRAFPYGLNCPIPRAWPYQHNRAIDAGPWKKDKERWRGFNLVTKILAEGQHNVSEYEIEGQHLGTGLSCRLFDKRCDEYDDFVSVLRLRTLKKLQLSLFVDGQDSIHVGWSAFRTGLLRNALAEATELEHVSISTGWHLGSREEQLPGPKSFLPIDYWTKLQHFELWHIEVAPAELLSAIAQLPEGLLSLQLNFLRIFPGSYREVLDEMRDQMRWHEHRPQTRMIIGVPVDHYTRGRAIWIEEEIDEFLKRGGINPFAKDDGSNSDKPRYGMGVVRDAFDSNYVRPWLDDATYRELGYYRIYD